MKNMLTLTYKVKTDELASQWDWPIRHWQIFLINELGFDETKPINVELTPDYWAFTQEK